MFKKLLLSSFAATFTLITSTSLSADASNFTKTSPIQGGRIVPSGVSEVGGVVLDLVGLNDNRVTSQLAASQLFEGFFNSGNPVAFQGNPGTIGIQSGFVQSVIDALGGGLKEAAVRITLFDGDTAAGDFDFNANELLVNGVNFGNFSSVNAENTNSSGTSGSLGFSGGGFRNGTLDTGWFYSNNSSTLASLFGSLTSGNQVTYQLNDLSNMYDNFFDFTQGVNSSLVNVGQGPVVQPIPTPALVPGVIGFTMGVLRRRKSKKASESAEMTKA